MTIKSPKSQPHVIEVQIDGTNLNVWFDDGNSGALSLAPLLDVPAFAALKKDEYRDQVRIDHGIICWPGGEDLDPWWVHEQALGYGVTREDEKSNS